MADEIEMIKADIDMTHQSFQISVLIRNEDHDYEAYCITPGHPEADKLTGGCPGQAAIHVHALAALAVSQGTMLSAATAMEIFGVRSWPYA